MTKVDETMGRYWWGIFFKLGDLYSKALDGHVLNETGKTVPMKMGCYGIGIGQRLLHQLNEIMTIKGLYGLSLAPFEVDMIVIGKDRIS